MIVEMCGNCCHCGKWLGPLQYAAREVVAAVGPEGAVVLCAKHLTKDGPDGPIYKAAVRAMAEAKTKQIREAKTLTPEN